MFQGEYSNSMDDKGRVSIPAAFREALRRDYGDDRIVVTRTPHDPCLNAYPIRVWNRLLARLNQQQPSRELRAYRRIVLGSAQEYTPDKQGRILIPQNLREYAGLTRAVQFAGAGEIFEIWDRATWDRQLEADLALARNFEPGL